MSQLIDGPLLQMGLWCQTHHLEALSKFKLHVIKKCAESFWHAFKTNSNLHFTHCHHRPWLITRQSVPAAPDIMAHRGGTSKNQYHCTPPPCCHSPNSQTTCHHGKDGLEHLDTLFQNLRYWEIGDLLDGPLLHSSKWYALSEHLRTVRDALL